MSTVGLRERTQERRSERTLVSLAARPPCVPGLLRRGLARIGHDPLAALGVALTAIVLLVCDFAPLLATHDPNALDLRAKLAPPSGAHLFGTDEMGRGLFSRLVYGCRLSVTTGFVILIVTLLIGSALGALGGYAGGPLDWVVMRLADFFIALPSLILAMGELIVRLLPGVRYSLSSQVVPVFREYERMLTTAANASTQPLVETYLENLAGCLTAGGYLRNLYVMRSTGGITTTATTVDVPVCQLESGPAGAPATAYLGKVTGEDSLLAFDMGGTTAKACIVDRGTPTRTKYFETVRVERLIKGSRPPTRSPVIDMFEIGAGGVGIAWLDPQRRLDVGPRSAGAEPGPACYDRGGTRPTVTDADLVLGYLEPAFFAGGSMRLAPGRAQAAIAEHLAAPLGMSTVDAAWVVYQVVNEHMTSAVRVHFAAKGRDPRPYTLLAFGGVGPLHAAPVARRLRSRRVLVPAEAGVLSAFGFLKAPISFDFIRTHITRIDRAPWSTLNEIYAEMETRGRAVLTEAGVPEAEPRPIRNADMRYIGQMDEITVPVPDGPLTAASEAAMADFVHRGYEARYGRHVAEAPIEGLNWRLLAIGPVPPSPSSGSSRRPTRPGPSAPARALAPSFSATTVSGRRPPSSTAIASRPATAPTARP